MKLEKLKAQQAALQAHSSSQEHLTVLVKTFGDGAPALSAAIMQAFARLGLQAGVRWGCNRKWESLFGTRIVAIS